MGMISTGYTFFRVSEPDERWRITMLHRTLEALGGSQQIKKAFAKAEDTTTLSLEQVCERAALSKRGGYLTFDLAGFRTDLEFPRENSPAPFYYLTWEVPTGAFLQVQGDPMRVEIFGEAWTRLCDAQGAEVAFFPDGIRDSEVFIPDYLSALQQNNLHELVGPGYWRTYFSQAAADRWHNQLIETWKDQSEILPSGALILYAGRGYNPEWGDWDALLNARFLIKQIESHTEVPGSERLLEILHREEQQLQAIEDQPTELRYHENTSINRAVLKQARIQLDYVRATWACALQQTGLVGVEQSVTSKEYDGTTEQVLVPIVADQGRTWVIATLLHPFHLDEPAWNDLQTGLEAQVWRLLIAAEHHLSLGESPRVVVYFWRGVSEQVRETLLAMGVSVEVADHLPLLEKI